MEYLTHFDNAKREIELAATIDEAKGIRDKAEACRVYARQAGESLTMQNRCAEIKIRAERRAGELLAKMEKNKGGQSTTSSIVRPVLSDLGINKTQSSRWQAIASLPKSRFEAHIAETVAAEKELTTTATLKLAKAVANRIPSINGQQRTGGMESVDDLQSLIDSGVRYGCIYADPPWKYGNQGTRAATDNHYETMTVEEICQLPIESLAAESSHLHLWTTNAFLPESFKVIESWGFTYKSVLVWVKPQMGIGNYWRVSHEFLLLGTRGKAPFHDHSQMSWKESKRTGHSRKPECFRSMIEEVSIGPYLELFGRRSCEDWTVWGNQIEKGLFG